MFLECQKAFDTALLKRLVKKLDFQLSIRGRLIRWTENHRSGREQRKQIRGRFSQWVGITTGVPKGLVLEPLFFLIYVTDLPEGRDSHSNTFVDDAEGMIEVRNARDCINIEGMDKLQSLFHSWLMKFNSSKWKAKKVGHNGNKALIRL